MGQPEMTSGIATGGMRVATEAFTSEKFLHVKGGRFYWSGTASPEVTTTNTVKVKITRNGIRVGCKVVTWAAWDEILSLVGDM